uniref:PLAT domain-containing protein n=1 Tax=Macrostomum lignano TaxID=282301 RepID=A0A1I8FRG6_9PLAT
TVQLSRADVLRTWQPSGAHCRWWESRGSQRQTDSLLLCGPGLGWLVMQLRQPMMLEAVSVRDWDGQWLRSSSVGSPVSAVGASSLPLELQLEDPWPRQLDDTFGSSDRWRQLRESKAEKRHLEAMGDGAIICFMVRSCELVGEDGPHLPSCCISCDGPIRQDLRPLRSSNASEGMIEAHYSLEAKHTHHNQKLKCSNGRAVVEKTLGIIGDPADVSPVAVRSPVWVAGRRVSHQFHFFNSYPTPLHNCQVNFTNGQFKNMTPVAMTQRPTKSLLNRTVVTVTTYYETVADGSVQRAAIRACRTDIYLGYFTGPTGTDEQSRRIHVTFGTSAASGVSVIAAGLSTLEVVKSKKRWIKSSKTTSSAFICYILETGCAPRELADSLQRNQSGIEFRLLKLPARQRSQDFRSPKKSGWKVKRPKKSVTLPPRVRPTVNAWRYRLPIR